MKNLFDRTKRTSTVIALLSTLLYSLTSSAQEEAKDSVKTKPLEEVIVKATRADEKTPVTFSNFTKKDFSKRNLGQDIPVLMNYLPSVVTTTDAGNGVGYTGIRVRGSDATRVNVTINGIPYNDSESHGTYWVNMPDFASSTESIQLQRGVGTSTNGAGAFGASLNLATESSAKAGGEIANSYGSFNTHKHTVKFSTGLLNENFELSGRLSQIKSDGYVDRAFSDLKSYFLQGNYFGKTTQIKALVFGGKEHTYQSWNGIDAATLHDDPTFNSAGMYTDEFGNTRYYDNETDNYQQDHAQLHWNEKLNDNLNLNMALHYTKGKGYYENYKEDAAFNDYGMTPTAGQTSTDLVRQKWLDNHFYGTTFSLNYKTEKLDAIFGGAINKYEGDHFGKVIWARYASTSELGDHYYDDYGNKTDANAFLKATYQILDNLSLYGDLQLRNVNYEATGVQADKVTDDFNFFNPKAGLTYEFNTHNNLYFSYAKAHREPNRTDYENGSPKPEKLDDFELGWRYNTEKIKVNLNGYYMAYKDQLVLTGKLDDVGSPIRENSGDSYRLGIEAEAKIALSPKWFIAPNISISESLNKDFYTDASGTLEPLGNTNIAYSPKFIAGNMIAFSPVKNVSIALLSKFVGKQYLNNINDKNSYLSDYFINDFSFNWNIPMNKVFKEISINVLCNNVFNRKYVSNAFDYGGGYIYYYPQAGANFLTGVTLKF
ncbi:TonB-dependent receptor [Flavobacterium amniphilum]|uniref:TonB-dependent receptor n=1 Tax=Flavobacterium amniphilum TaxID=1834035 RepID=UPI00202A6F2E|nr:TonB-dependent receptor [Flavobacterium amniphilum]MCL9807373.1 TonB-dependent receptor [Flavobacterium amniphilum]